MLQTFLLFLFLIFLNAAFASAEIAVISISDARLKNLADGGNKKAARLSALTAQPAKFLATIQVAITMAGFLQGATAADQFSEILVSFLVDSGIGIPEQILAPVCLFVITCDFFQQCFVVFLVDAASCRRVYHGIYGIVPAGLPHGKAPPREGLSHMCPVRAAQALRRLRRP